MVRSKVNSLNDKVPKKNKKKNMIVLLFVHRFWIRAAFVSFSLTFYFRFTSSELREHLKPSDEINLIYR